MTDAIPAPFGDVTRRWCLLPQQDQDRHSRRLLGVALDEVSIERPVDVEQQRQYRTLLDAALEGDAIAFSWLADSHAPLLIARGRPLYHADPDEWGDTALEVLFQGLQRGSAAEEPWARRRVALHLCSRMSRAVQRYLDRTRHAQLVDPVQLSWRSDAHTPVDSDPHLDLTIAVDEALAELEPSVRAGICAVTAFEPLSEVAAAHDISETLLRQRISRARRQLRPQLAAFSRSV